MRVTPTLLVDEGWLVEEFVTSGGPGGQNVNKVATAVQLRLDMRQLERAWPVGVVARVKTLAGRRLSGDGWLVMVAQRHRTQLANRKDARARLLALLQRAAAPVVPRKATAPTAGSVRRRLVAKVKVGVVKKLRGQVIDDEV